MTMYLPTKVARLGFLALVAAMMLAACGAGTSGGESGEITIAPINTSIAESPATTPPTESAPTTASGVTEDQEASTTIPADGETTTTAPSDSGEGDDGAVTDHPAHVVTAMDDLAARQGVSPSAIEMILFEDVTWPDGSLGCPQPGLNYTQALIEGYRIVLAIDGQEFAYHGGQNGDPKLCETPITDVRDG